MNIIDNVTCLSRAKYMVGKLITGFDYDKYMELCNKKFRIINVEITIHNYKVMMTQHYDDEMKFGYCKFAIFYNRTNIIDINSNTVPVDHMISEIDAYKFLYKCIFVKIEEQVKMINKQKMECDYDCFI